MSHITIGFGSKMGQNGLKERVGVRLLSRTTRGVAPTDAGELIARLRPALGDVNSVLDEIAGLRERPTGRVRVVMPRLAAKMVLGMTPGFTCVSSSSATWSRSLTSSSK